MSGGRHTIAALCLALTPGLTCAQELSVESEAADITARFDWGYRVGVKQPLGSVLHGRAVHQISKKRASGLGSPDYLVWIDRSTGERGVIETPINEISEWVVNPGGMAVFQVGDGAIVPDGHLWWVYCGRANDLPFDMFSSSSPYSATAWDKRLDDFVTDQGSTTPCIRAVDDELALVYRNGASSWARTTLRYQRYDTSGPVPEAVEVTDLARGMPHPEWNIIGIEQLWTRYDPRQARLFATWQWFRVDEHLFGSNPLLVSDDFGRTWSAVDGSRPTLPVTYEDMTPALMPYDHLAAGEHTGWYVRDVGAAPDGTPWMTLPAGDVDFSNAWQVAFWRWDGGAWTSQMLTEGMHYASKPHACGATRDYLVFVYSEESRRDEILLRYSRDNGASWSDPVLIDTVPEGPQGQGRTVCWVSYFQPAERYVNNEATFLVGYYRDEDYEGGRLYRNKLRSVTVRVGPRSDLNGDGVTDITDFVRYLDAFGGDAPDADYDDNGVADTRDFVRYLGDWQAERS